MFERCNRKRLTLTPHYDPRVEEIVVYEVLSVFKTFDEELTKAEEEEKRRLEEEKRRLEEEEKKRQEDQQKLLSVNITPEDRGKQAVESEPHPLVLVLQEKLVTQAVEQEKIKEDIKNLSEGQERVIKNQEDISSKLNAILAHFARNP
ncbi:hypothetical protein A2U01_0049967 [Trifolium medium]|uniref:Uncharacterized protein n=1 Tax=Trifolium medium TaxID=97028 RepID=A0A392QZQ9_9FABA|nr:hypothetical protein [Trifolium medium]